MIDNNEIAKILREISFYLEMKEVPFKPQAYEKAAHGVEGLDEEVIEIYQKGGLEALKQIPGVGFSIAQKIEELIKTGHLRYYEELKKEIPIDLDTLAKIEGLGPKKIKILYQKLEIKDINDLEKAAREGKIRKLEGFGLKSEEKILKGIEFLRKSGQRFILGFIMPYIRELEDRLRALKEVERLEVAGSVRRRKETIGDVDFLVISKKPKKVMDYFISLEDVVYVYAHGETKSMVKMKNGLDVDLRVVAKESYGSALNYFTGSKEHNIALRELAVKKGYKLNEYGLFKGKKRIAGEIEEEIYQALGLDYIEPEMRENNGEIELALKKQLPKLISYDALKGDLQVQTNWSDGLNSIEEMAQEAIKLGLEYIVVTDHTKRLAMAHGLDEKRLKAQWQEIDRLNLKFKKQSINFKILKGTECDILKDGSLDLSNRILAKLDVVGASIHSYFNLSKKEQTERIKKAMQNPYVDIIFHPTGRIINRRPPYEIDIEEIIKEAKKTKTILEIDAYPDRLDLKDEYIRKCVKEGVKLVIDSDAHNLYHFSYLEYGLAQARRGWATKKDIINAWSLEKMLSFLKRNQ